MAMSASSATNEGIRVPIFSYFLIIGSVLTGLLFYANSVMVPSPPPFSVSQKIGLPEPYKAPAVVAEAPKPAIFSITVEPAVKVKKSAKAAGKHKQMRVVRQVVREGRYAAYPPHDPLSTNRLVAHSECRATRELRTRHNMERLLAKNGDLPTGLGHVAD